MKNIKEIFVVADKILVKNFIPIVLLHFLSHFFIIGFEHIMGWYEGLSRCNSNAVKVRHK